MKVFTQVGQQDHDQVKPENINDNTKAVIGEYNGRLDGQNFPVGTIDKLKFAPSIKTNNTASNIDGFDYVGQTQNYHRVRRWKVLDSGTDIHSPLLSFDLQNESWSSGWNNLTEIDSTFENLVLEFEAESGLIHGCFDINFRHGVDRILDDADPAVVQTWSIDWWSRWGIFCNDVLIAETGRVYPRLSNLCVPFKLFVGAQPVRLELKWQTIDTSAEKEYGQTVHKSVMEIYGAAIWACNTKR
jgi:hypothetical protein